MAEVNELFRLVGFAFRYLRNHLGFRQVLFFRRLFKPKLYGSRLFITVENP